MLTCLLLRVLVFFIRLYSCYYFAVFFPEISKPGFIFFSGIGV